MNKILRLTMLGMLVLPLLLGSSLALAKGGGAAGHGGGAAKSGGVHSSGTPSGFSKGEKKGWKGEKTPPGWSHGKKKGWGDAKMPPGLAKKQEASEETETTTETED